MRGRASHRMLRTSIVGADMDQEFSRRMVLLPVARLELVGRVLGSRTNKLDKPVA